MDLLSELGELQTSEERKEENLRLIKGYLKTPSGRKAIMDARLRQYKADAEAERGRQENGNQL